MAMMQAFEGYIGEDGRFVADNPAARLPVNGRVVVNVVEHDRGKDKIINMAGEKSDRFPAGRIAHERQVAAMRQFFADLDAMDENDDVMTDSDWDELANMRKRTNAGMARAITL